MKELINLERLKSHMAKEFGLTVAQINDYLQTEVFNKEIGQLTQRELRQILTNANGELKRLFGVYANNLKSNWQGLFDHRYQLQAGQTYRQSLNTPKSLQAYADKLFDKPLNLTANTGISLNELLAKFSDDEAKKITNAIRLAHYEGLPNGKLVQMIRGSKAQRYQDGILATTTRHAKTIANTGMAIMASEAKQQFIKDNKDIVRGIKVVATLDLRTSAICRHLDGEFMPIERAKYPPYHFNCRSSFQIVSIDYEEPKNRTSMNGVVENQTYYEWLKGQNKADIQQVLGKKKAELFLSDGMTAKKFKQLQFDRVFSPMNLKELIEAENTAKIIKPSYQIVNLKNLKPRQSEVLRLQYEPIKRGEKPKTPRPAEAELADLLQQYFGIYLVRYDDRYHKSSPTGNPPDFTKKDNDLPAKKWQTLDMMFTMLIDDIKGIVAMNYAISEHKRHARNWRVLQEQIIEHIEKSDIVPLDLRHWNDENRTKIIKFVLSLTNEQQQKILFIEK